MTGPRVSVTSTGVLAGALWPTSPAVTTTAVVGVVPVSVNVAANSRTMTAVSATSVTGRGVVLSPHWLSLSAPSPVKVLAPAAWRPVPSHSAATAELPPPGALVKARRALVPRAESSLSGPSARSEPLLRPRKISTGATTCAPMRLASLPSSPAKAARLPHLPLRRLPSLRAARG